MNKTIKKIMNELSSALIAFGVTIFSYWAFNYFGAPIEGMLAAVIFILILILLKD